MLDYLQGTYLILSTLRWWWLVVVIYANSNFLTKYGILLNTHASFTHHFHYLTAILAFFHKSRFNIFGKKNILSWSLIRCRKTASGSVNFKFTGLLCTISVRGWHYRFLICFWFKIFRAVSLACSWQRVISLERNFFWRS